MDCTQGGGQQAQMAVVATSDGVGVSVDNDDDAREGGRRCFRQRSQSFHAEEGSINAARTQIGDGMTTTTLRTVIISFFLPYFFLLL